MLKRKENLAKLEEEDEEEEEEEEDDDEDKDDEEEEVEGLEDLLGQMYNNSRGMTKALLRVVKEGKAERKKEEEMVEICFEEEERVYQVIFLSF